MQDSENKAKKKKKRPGFTDKRFWMRDPIRQAVEDYALMISGKELKEYDWSQAIEKIVETHPVAKKFIRQ